ncbi:hypothetical protein EIM17_21165 [Pseudomonas aeruginosa]|uniref:mechanosensitive ion channel domain-containing protein n=4 Tax=Pseudomonas aeruginosa TaxID=287 RepID=UPI000F621B9A|nr:hypothetical protein EIM17_21165 [Pseudomonas aeruginosa]
MSPTPGARRPCPRAYAPWLLSLAATLLLAVGAALAQWDLESILSRAEQRYGELGAAKSRLGDWGRLLEQGGTLDEAAKLRAVNDFFNRSLRFTDDIEIWQQEDYWATPVEALVKGAADCEDYAIAKYVTLRRLGVASDKLRITYVKALRLNQAHMVLTWYASPGADPLVLAFLPVGSSPSELLQGFAQLGESSKTLGNLNIVPQDILVALLLFVGGLFALRIVKRWLSERLLPETNMDAGMRASLVTLVGYLGFVLLAMLVMSTLRINLTSLTWVVSALSVGIGFGLQAIVQNFISGLILLTERPVKVGDWVSLGGVEGDIRRINVRATEIQMGDRSTVIVPNSQFISQTVRNVTMGNALGVVGVNLTLPLDTDAMKVRELLLQAFAEHPAILDAPAPSVTFKDLASNGLVLNASGFVNSPRSVAGARSDLLFTILDRLRSEGIALSSPQSLLMIQDGGPASAAPAPATPD